MINILIPAAGEGRRFRAAGYTEPKPLIPVLGKPMLSRVIQNVKPTRHDCRVILAVSPGMPRFYDCKNIVIPERTDGAARTAVIALHSAQVPMDEPLLIANADQLIDWDPDDFYDFALARPGRGVAVVFRADGNPKWSYAKINEHEQAITRIAEKDPISEYATAGIYWWPRVKDFHYAALDAIGANERVRGEFYIAPLYNHRPFAVVHPYKIPASAMHGLGTPEDLAAYLAERSVPV